MNRINANELRKMSDEELISLAAVNILGKRYDPKGQYYLSAGSDYYWDPIEGLDDAFVLVEALGDKYNFEFNRKPSGVHHLLYESIFDDGKSKYSAIDEKAARSMTMAAILAKEEGK